MTAKLRDTPSSFIFFGTNGAYFNHKKSSLSSEARGKHTWYNPSAFDLPYRLNAMPRMLPTSRGFSVPIIADLSSKC